MKKILTSAALCALTLLLCLLSSCGLFGEKLEFAESGDGYTVTGRGNVTTLDIEIPAEVNGKPVTAIGASAFAWGFKNDGTLIPSLTSIKIPDSVTKIGDLAFSGNNKLTSLTLPAAVSVIGVGAFRECSSLTSIVIPEGVETIEANTFRECTSLSSVTLPSSVTKIESNAFYGCTALTSIELPAHLVELGDGAFSGCSSLSSPITIPDTVTALGSEVFSGTAEDLVVTVSYDELPEYWADDWFEGMNGEAINNSDTYYQNVVLPNQAKLAELQAELDAQQSIYDSYAEQIEGTTAYLNTLKKNASINPSDYQLQQIDTVQKELNNLIKEQRAVSSKMSEIKEQMANCKTTNKLN